MAEGREMDFFLFFFGSRVALMRRASVIAVIVMGLGHAAALRPPGCCRGEGGGW
jgi:hypothetical protein